MTNFNVISAISAKMAAQPYLIFWDFLEQIPKHHVYCAEVNVVGLVLDRIARLNYENCLIS